MMGIIQSGHMEITAISSRFLKVMKNIKDICEDINLNIQKETKEHILKHINNRVEKNKNREKYLKRCRNRDILYRKRIKKYGKF